jgi:hypothetical protein
MSRARGAAFLSKLDTLPFGDRSARAADRRKRGLCDVDGTVLAVHAVCPEYAVLRCPLCCSSQCYRRGSRGYRIARERRNTP